MGKLELSKKFEVKEEYGTFVVHNTRPQCVKCNAAVPSMEGINIDNDFFCSKCVHQTLMK